MKNWKTTLAGIGGGFALAIDPLIQAYQSGAFSEKSGGQLIAAILIVLLGVWSKDHNVSGTVQKKVAGDEEGLTGTRPDDRKP